MNRKGQFEVGLIDKNQLSILISALSQAKGMLATLELGHHCLWIKKYERTPKEHLRILLSEVTEEIYMAETALQHLLI